MALHPPQIELPASYVASLGLTRTAQGMLQVVTERRLRGLNVCLSVKAWARLLKRSVRQVIRASGELQARGLLRKIRRGWHLTNIYLLPFRLWARFTGRSPRVLEAETQQILFRLGKRSGVPERVMARCRVFAPSPGA